MRIGTKSSGLKKEGRRLSELRKDCVIIDWPKRGEGGNEYRGKKILVFHQESFPLF
jgi:hypothetical protein